MIFNYLLLLLSSFLISACANKTAITEDKISVFDTEEKAAYQGALNKPATLPIFILKGGSKVTVLHDRYGKDYWACKIKTEKGKVGWALCNSLHFTEH